MSQFKSSDTDRNRFLQHTPGVLEPPAACSWN